MNCNVDGLNKVSSRSQFGSVWSGFVTLLMAGLVTISCGVRGRPQPPAKKPFIGDGVPKYYKATPQSDSSNRD